MNYNCIATTIFMEAISNYSRANYFPLTLGISRDILGSTGISLVVVHNKYQLSTCQYHSFVLLKSCSILK